MADGLIMQTEINRCWRHDARATVGSHHYDHQCATPTLGTFAGKLATTSITAFYQRRGWGERWAAMVKVAGDTHQLAFRPVWKRIAQAKPATSAS